MAEYHIPTPSTPPTESSQTFGKTEVLKAALSYGKRKIPVFPLKGKVPLTPRGFKDATTDRARIHAWWTRYPGANIGVPTGGMSGLVVVDKDGSGPETDKIWGELPPTLEAETSRGRHRYYRVPKGTRVPTRKLAPELDLKADGGYVVAPPSTHPDDGTRYRFVEETRALGIAPLPEGLLEPATSDSQRGKTVRNITTAASVTAKGAVIPQGERDNTLTSIAGRLHDGTRSLDDLVAELLDINAQRCEPPLPDAQVLKIARSIHGREPCRSGRPKEVDDLVEALSDFWHGQRWQGVAGKSEARFARALIREGREVGKAIPAGLRVEKSFRQMAEILGTHRNTITNIVRRGKAAGWLRQDNARRSGTESGAFVLLDPRRVCDTSTKVRRLGVSVTSSSRSVAELSTPHYRHRGPVGYSREHTLCVFEAHGPQSRESAAELLGWSRPRDLERLHLEHLVGLGLLEKRDGLYTFPGDCRERADAVRRERYSTVQARVRRIRSVEGRWVHVVGESGMDASELERARLAREKHKLERDAHRQRSRGEDPPTDHVANIGADGFASELEPVPEVDEALRDALRGFLRRNPHRRDEHPSWLAVTLWAEGYTPAKAPPLAVELALADLALGGAEGVA